MVLLFIRTGHGVYFGDGLCGDVHSAVRLLCAPGSNDCSPAVALIHLLPQVTCKGVQCSLCSTPVVNLFQEQAAACVVQHSKCTALCTCYHVRITAQDNLRSSFTDVITAFRGCRESCCTELHVHIGSDKEIALWEASLPTIGVSLCADIASRAWLAMKRRV